VTRLAVIGHPVAHSLSPALFAEIAAATGRAIDYRRVDVAPEALAARLREAAALREYRGWNVTIPHKKRVVTLLDSVDSTARAVGAVNVVTFAADGTTSGANTDVAGVDLVFARHGMQLRGASVAILGTGGAARAVAAAAARRSADRVTFVSRSAERAATLAAEFADHYPAAAFDGTVRLARAASYGLFVNATPLGMLGFTQGSALPEDAPPGAWAFDCVYRPERTPFLASAAERGMRIATGIDMLVGQALAAYELWFGEPVCAPQDPLYATLAAAVRKAV
jgi:shikimate dehydrogenase